MTKRERERSQDEAMNRFINEPEPQEGPRADFERVLRAYYRRAGPAASEALRKGCQ